MMSTGEEAFTLDSIEEYSLLDHFLYYGLLVGAFFQLACICAVVFIPKSESEKELDYETQETPVPGGGTPKHEQHLNRRNAKHERKKRR